jgi:hypothetical protein
MPLKSQLLVGIQAALAAGFGFAAVEGGASVGAAGVFIARLAYDWIGWLVLTAAFGSCLTASLSLAQLLRSRRKHDAAILLFAFATAVLAVSPFVNAPDTFGFNGWHVTVVTYPVFLWLGCLFVVLVLGHARHESKPS